MSWLHTIGKKLLATAGKTTPTYDGVGGGRRALSWSVGNPGAVAAMLFNQNELRAKSRDLVRRNAWANDSTVKHPADKNRAMLPYGFVQSPTLASLALFDSRLGGYLEQLKKIKYVVVSVYMDDIIVSTKRKKRLADIHKELVAASVKSRSLPMPCGALTTRTRSRSGRRRGRSCSLASAPRSASRVPMVCESSPSPSDRNPLKPRGQERGQCDHERTSVPLPPFASHVRSFLSAPSMRARATI